MSSQLACRQSLPILLALSSRSYKSHRPLSLAARNFIISILKKYFHAKGHLFQSILLKLLAYLHRTRADNPQPSAQPAGATSFPLLKLPTELRLQVYGQILDDVRVLEHERFHPIVAPDFSILRASRLVYGEARTVYYDEHQFGFETAAEISKLSAPQQQRIKHVKLFFCFGHDDVELALWTALCRAVAALPAVRTLEIEWRVFWHPHAFPTLPALALPWARGLAALRSMSSVRVVDGRITTNMSERPETGNFVIEFKGLDGLNEAFWNTQLDMVQEVYDA